MEDKINQIWTLALPFQDKRQDEGHAEIATKYAYRLLKEIPQAKRSIVTPAIILHDIGWSQMPKEKLMVAYTKQGKEQKYAARLEHQVYALDLALEILQKVDYDPACVGPILVIIAQHDTRKGYYTLEDAIVRDADKLWRYSKRQLVVTVQNKGWTKKEEVDEHLAKSKRNIKKDGFFLTNEARAIARRDFAKYQEFGLKMFH